MQSRIKRKYTRHPRHFEVQISSGGRVYHTTTQDLSLGGMAIESCPDLALDETVKLFVSVQENLYDSLKLLLLTAVPVWHADQTMGLRFCDVPRDIRESLAALTSPADYLSTTESEPIGAA